MLLAKEMPELMSLWTAGSLSKLTDQRENVIWGSSFLSGPEIQLYPRPYIVCISAQNSTYKKGSFSCHGDEDRLENLWVVPGWLDSEVKQHL